MNFENPGELAACLNDAFAELRKKGVRATDVVIDITIILNDSDDNLLKSDHINGAYVLYPKAGMENYDAIKEKIRNIFQ